MDIDGRSLQLACLSSVCLCIWRDNPNKKKFVEPRTIFWSFGVPVDFLVHGFDSWNNALFARDQEAEWDRIVYRSNLRYRGIRSGFNVTDETGCV